MHSRVRTKLLISECWGVCVTPCIMEFGFRSNPTFLGFSAGFKPVAQPLYAGVMFSLWSVGAWALPYASLEPKNVFTVSGANVMSNPAT